MGAWHEREHKWINTAVLPKKSGLHDDYATGDQYGNGVIEQPTNPERDLDARHLIRYSPSKALRFIFEPAFSYLNKLTLYFH